MSLQVFASLSIRQRQVASAPVQPIFHHLNYSERTTCLLSNILLPKVDINGSVVKKNQTQNSNQAQE